MRILLTIHHPLDRNSGAPGAAISLAEAMRAAGDQVDLLSHDDLPRWARSRVALFAFPLLVMWRAFRGRRRYDVLDYLTCDGWMATFLPRRLRPRVLAVHSQGLEHLVHEHMLEDAAGGRGKRPSWKYHFYRGSIHLWTVARAIRGADVAFLLNRFEIAYVCDEPRAWIDKSRVAMTFNGVADEALNALACDPPINAAPLGIAFIGTFIERKGIAYLMPALERHLERYENARAALLGTSFPADVVLEKVKPGARSRIRVVPQYQRGDLPSLLSGSHVLVLPSLGEGFSLACVEAMALGMVPVVTRGHGFEEAVADGVSGILIDRGSTEQIVDALDRLERDRPSTLRMREEAMKLARKFTWSAGAAIRIEGYGRVRAVPEAIKQTQSQTTEGFVCPESGSEAL